MHVTDPALVAERIGVIVETDFVRSVGTSWIFALHHAFVILSIKLTQSYQ